MKVRITYDLDQKQIDLLEQFIDSCVMFDAIDIKFDVKCQSLNQKLQTEFKNSYFVDKIEIEQPKFETVYER